MRDDMTLVGARIHTMDLDRPTATAIAFRHGRVAELDPKIPTGRIIDLKGRTVLPGFIDSHVHFAMGAETLAQVDLEPARSRKDFERLVAERASRSRSGEWVIARNWSEENLAGGERPDKSWLAVAGEHPCVCWRMDYHGCVVNEAALRILAAHHRLTEDPPGGQILRDATGEPTGVLKESAAWVLLLPHIPPLRSDLMRDALTKAGKYLASLGVTAVGGMETPNIIEDHLEALRDHLAVRILVTLFHRDWPLDLSFAHSFSNGDRLAIIGSKAFVDGAFGQRTARMFEPYTDAPESRGMFVEYAQRGVLTEWMRFVRSSGLSPSVHAIGDEAVHVALNAIDDTDGPDAPPVRIEHAQTVAPTDIHRFAGRFVSMQPLHKPYDCRSALSKLGPQRLNRFFPFRALADAGGRLAFGSDWPVVSPDPIRGMAAAITGLDLAGTPFRPEDNITIHEALVAYTRTAAECLQFDAGVLRVGRLADCVVLDRDPYDCDWVNHQPRVLMTVLGGEVTFEA
ncbi:MAG: amidohydrolase [Phycisphaerae bacterium]|jgi:predicted amidohydrolase YtcJ|nr:amidohydrolase [Phycisphaerae bacterium]